MTHYYAHLAQVSNRFAQALEQNELDAVLIYSGNQSYAFRDDNSLPFKINPYFKYWLPLTEQQGAFLWIKPGQRPRLFLQLKQDYWHAQPVVPDGEWQAFFDIQIIDRPEAVFTALSIDVTRTAIIGELTTIANALPNWPTQNLNHTGLLDYLDYYRAYKTPYEIDCLRQANKLAAKAHKAAKHTFFQGCSELEVHLAYLSELQVRESDLPYNNIIAFNENAAVLHYDQYQITTPKTRRSFLIDAGASYQGYHADISRTYIDPKADNGNEFQAMFACYERLYHSLIDQIQIGKGYLSLHDSAHRKLSQLLVDFDILKCSGEDAYQSGYSRLFFPCGTGHYIGLQVHDVGGHLASANGDRLAKDPRYPFLRMLRPIEAQTVFTVEPGIYFIDLLLSPMRDNPDFNWSRIEQFKMFGGFRMEDSLAFTENGVENLSAPYL